MVDKLFFVILVLNTTGLFAFIAPQFSIKIGAITLVMLVLNISYLFIKRRYCKVVFRQSRMMSAWLFVLLIWPLLTALYAPSFDIRTIGLQLYYFTLFMGTVVYAIANGESAIRRLMIISLTLTLFGLVLNLMAPQYFEAVANLADAEIERQGRAFGFLLQPNQLAISIGLLFIGLFAFWISKSNIWLQTAALLIFMLAVLLTGSRTGMLVAIIILVFILLNNWNHKMSVRKFLVNSGVPIICLAALNIGMNYYLLQSKYVDSSKVDLINRIEKLLSFRLSDDGIKNEQSIILRQNAQAAYLSLIFENPLGYGLGSGEYYQDKGLLSLSAHSSMLASALDFGGLYPVVFCLLIILLYKGRKHRGFETFLQSNSIGQFIFVSVFLFIISSILSTRSFYIVLGIFFAAICFSKYVFRYSIRTQ